MMTKAHQLNNEIETGLHGQDTNNGDSKTREHQLRKTQAYHPKHSNNPFSPHIVGKVAKICFRNSIIMPFLPGALSFRSHRIAPGIETYRARDLTQPYHHAFGCVGSRTSMKANSKMKMGFRGQDTVKDNDSNNETKAGTWAQPRERQPR
jgi:hypothetical protein